MDMLFFPLSLTFVVLVIFLLIGVVVHQSDKKRCPACRSWVPKKATKCKHCGGDLAAPADSKDGGGS